MARPFRNLSITMAFTVALAIGPGRSGMRGRDGDTRLLACAGDHRGKNRVCLCR